MASWISFSPCGVSDDSERKRVRGFTLGGGLSSLLLCRAKMSAKSPTLSSRSSAISLSRC